MPSFSVRAALIAVLFASEALAQTYAPYPQPDAGYVTDRAGVLSLRQEERLEQLLRRVETTSGTEIIVVTVSSIGEYEGTENATIEAFATALFNRWGIGNAPRNDGVLLLVAVDDRKARIELGAGYPPSRDADAAAIMRDTIVPRFRGGDYAGGITAGTRAIVRDFTSVRVGVPWKLILLPVAIVILLVVGVSLMRNGKRGWGWVFVGLALVLVVTLLYLLVAIARSRSSSRGWRPGGAGGFGGGFSRGGGATGSW